MHCRSGGGGGGSGKPQFVSANALRGPSSIKRPTQVCLSIIQPNVCDFCLGALVCIFSPHTGVLWPRVPASPLPALLSHCCLPVVLPSQFLQAVEYDHVENQLNGC